MGEIRFVGVDSYPGGKDAYRDQVFNLVKDIAANPVGGVIVGGIVNTTTKHLTIRPESERPKESYDSDRTYTGSVAATFSVNSAGKPEHAGAAPKGLSRTAEDGPGKWYAGRNDIDDPKEPDVDERYNAAPEEWGDPNGTGSHAALYFTLREGNNKACSSGAGMCARLDDDILLHEMVHALRIMQGVHNPVPTTLRYKNEEEFLALVVTNVYISKKKGNTLLRPDYLHYGPLQPPWNTSDGFLKDDENRRILEYHSTKWQPVFGQLGGVQTAFNPFSAFKKPRKP